METLFPALIITLFAASAMIWGDRKQIKAFWKNRRVILQQLRAVSSRIWPRINRWWHCLWGIFSGHRMQNTYIQKHDPGYISGRHEISWIGCKCGRAFWGKTDWPPLTPEEHATLRRSGFDV